ncbi:MAG: hypothetical protein GXP53_00070 [Deltaproteobacteria bacterium]|nr:hypothetical protein [Deltaproteobacteria bacterium]
MVSLTMFILSLFIAIAGKWGGFDAFSPYAIQFLILGVFLFGYLLLKRTYYRSGAKWPENHGGPRQIKATITDYLKMLISWFDAFRQTYAVAPGLYYTGNNYSSDAPLLVTANYHLTVFLLLRHIRHLNVRLLVVDTDGINVWCSAGGKGIFSSQAVMKQINRYPGHLNQTAQKLSLILPKLSLSGVDLHELRKNNIRPIIGPVYAKDLPVYLTQAESKGRFTDQSEARVIFGFKARLFTWLPGMVQYMGYSILLFVGFLFIEQFWGLRAPFGIIPITAIIGTAYPLLFPYIPGHRFAVKGIFLAIFLSSAITLTALAGGAGGGQLISSVLFIFATAIFIGLTYTGNSAVSNYSRVRKEVARFLPVYVILYMASLVTYIIMEVS